MSRFFSLRRLGAMVRKEFIQILRDKLTLGMIIGIPMMQLTLFGFAINTNPRHLSTTVITQDHSPEVRTLLSALQNSRYFHLKYPNITFTHAQKLMDQTKLQFIIEIPANFTRELIRHEHPKILVISDGTDPSASGPALQALTYLQNTVFANDFAHNGLNHLQPEAPAFDFVIHNKYNPEQITQYNIVPGLVGVILTLTMIMITALAITREYEDGTMESLLATPLKPLEIILGKILPFVIAGYVQLCVILLLAKFLFHIPILGNLLALFVVTLPFMIANLMVGITFSTIAKNQLQAVQMSVFFFLPSILLTGFMFPFEGMPLWAQKIGSLLPNTYFLRMIRGILLKGNDWAMLWPDLWPILVFILVAGTICIYRFKKTL